MDEREAAARAAVVAEALSWVGTPFRHQGAIGSKATKGAAVDCALLSLRSYVDAGVIEEIDPRPYPKLWMLRKGAEELLLMWAARFAVETDEMLPGNIAFYKTGSCFSHCGILDGKGNLIHAWYRRGEAIISPLHQSDLCFNDDGTPRPRKIFDHWAPRP